MSAEAPACHAVTPAAPARNPIAELPPASRAGSRAACGRSAHKKSALIRLTDQGQTIITAVIDRERAILSQAGGDLTGADLAGCAKVLSRLLRFLDNLDTD